MDNLKPCPFCGGEKLYFHSYEPYYGYQGDLTAYRIVCASCGAKLERKEAEEAMKAWNRRADNDNG